MKYKIKYIIGVFVMTAFLTHAQEKKMDRADSDFSEYAFFDAIESYESLLKKGVLTEEIYKKLGDANFYNANYGVAADWYEKLYALMDANLDNEYLYRYALTLKSLEKYSESDLIMGRLQNLDKKDSRGQKFIANTGYRENIQRNSGRYTINNISINSNRSDYSPALYLDQLVFSTARDTGVAVRNINEWDKNPFNNLYSATITETGDFVNVSQFSPKLNTKTHEASAVFTKDGKTIFFTRNNSRNGKFSRDKEGVSRLKIYSANVVGQEWRNITELPFNSDEYSIAHPSLSSDGKTLYFASDMPGSFGASDIFSVVINSDGSYGEPMNLGEKINTKSRETFPFISENDVLYFASDGHPGLGGLDVFATIMGADQKQLIVNLGEPINSIEDDFSYIIDENTKKGYFASNRDGGIGSDDIYSFVENVPLNLDCSIKFVGIVKDAVNKNVLFNANITVLDAKGELVFEADPQSNGAFNFIENCKNSNYQFVVSKPGYETNRKSIEVSKGIGIQELEILLTPLLKEGKDGTDQENYVSLKPIFFDFDQFYLTSSAKLQLEKVLEYLIDFPHKKIEVKSYTDAKASKAYNKRLSEKRAMSTITYLIDKGIDKSRISGKGFGETFLLNDCSDNEICEEEEHKINRRSEFIVVE